MKNFFVILDGPMGAGKTTVTKLLRHKLPRTALVAWDTTKAMVSDFGTGNQDGPMLVTVQKDLVRSFIDQGLNIIIDAGFARGERMAPFIKLAKQKNYRLFIYQFTAPHEVLLKRAHGRPKFEWEKKKITKTNIEKNLHFYNENKYSGGAVTIDSHKRSPAQIANKILKDITS